MIISYSLGLQSELSPTGPYGGLIAKLKTHLNKVLQPGVCLFPDGGWKISSTRENSWLSKIYLCQFVAEEILGMKSSGGADETHAGWLLAEKNHYWPRATKSFPASQLGTKLSPRCDIDSLAAGKQAEEVIECAR